MQTEAREQTKKPPAFGEWVSVGERLPEDDEEVLIYIPWPGGEYEITMGIHVAQDGEGEWLFDDDSPAAGVTLWMPKPQPPTEASNEQG